MSLTVDGVWKAGVWATTVWADGVWREGVAVVTDTHDGFAEDEKHKKRKQRLHDELEKSFNSHFGIEAEEELSEFITPQVADSVVTAPIERVNWPLIWQRYTEVVQKLDKLAREREADDDETLLLLS